MNDSVDLGIDEDKTAFNIRAKASMREFLRAKSWVEKVKSIERMNVASRTAKEAMRKALSEKAGQSASAQPRYAEDVGG